MIRAVLFDLDGTLFDRASSVAACIEAQHARYRRILDNVSKPDYVARFVELDCRGYARKDEVYQQLAAEYALPASAAVDLFDDFYAHYHRHALALPHVHGVLATLRRSGLLLGIVTNGGAAHQNATIDALGIRAYIDAILISEAEGVRKPDPLIFQLALERLGVAAHEAVFVGDHPQADVEGAQNAGMRAIWKRDDYWGDCPRADAIVEDLGSLLAAIRSLPQEPL